MSQALHTFDQLDSISRARALDDEESVALEKAFKCLTLSPMGRAALEIHDRITGIQKAVCRHFGIPMAVMTFPNRDREHARARQIAMYLVRETTPLSFPAIGRKFGGRDHTTVLHGVRVIETLRKADPELDAAVNAIREQLEVA